MRVYLAGPITGLTYKGATDWREEFSKELEKQGHIGVSPMRGKDYLSEIFQDGEILQKTPATGFETVQMERIHKLQLSYEEFPMSSAQGIYGRDKYDTAHCEVVFANFLNAESISIGTCMEVQRGYDKDKFVLVAIEKQDNLNDHPFIRRAASCIVEDLETAMQVLTAFGKVYV